MSVHVGKTDGSGPGCDPPLHLRASARCVPFADRKLVTCPACLRHLAFSRAALKGQIVTEEAPPEPAETPLALLPDEPPEEELPANILKFPGR